MGDILMSILHLLRKPQGSLMQWADTPRKAADRGNMIFMVKVVLKSICGLIQRTSYV